MARLLIIMEAGEVKQILSDDPNTVVCIRDLDAIHNPEAETDSFEEAGFNPFAVSDGFGGIPTNDVLATQQGPIS